jgi:hypothetical protein
MTTSPLHRWMVVNIRVVGKKLFYIKYKDKGPINTPSDMYGTIMKWIQLCTQFCLRWIFSDDYVNCVVWPELFTQHGRWYVDQCISETVSLLDCPRFLDSPRIRRWVSFHVPLLSELEFRQQLPVVLGIHTLSARTCIARTAGRCYRNSVSDESGAWKLTSSTHPRVGLGPILHLLDGRNAL